MYKGIVDLSRAIKHSWVSTLLLILGDFAALALALLIALLLKYDTISMPYLLNAHIADRPISLLIGSLFYIISFSRFRLYRYTWRFASLEVLWSVVAANAIGLTCLIACQALIDGSVMSFTLLALFFLLSAIFVGGGRIILRLSSLRHRYGGLVWQKVKGDELPKRVVILSSGSNGAGLVSSLRDEQDNPYNVIGVLDDDPSCQGCYMRGVKVLGPLSKLNDLLKDRAVDEVLIALPQASDSRVRQYVMDCRQKKIPVKVIPALSDVLNGKARARVEDIRIEDLLRRPPVKINISEIGGYLTGKRVLVSGAGGSIGSELCRQICALNPVEVVLLGHGENSIHEIYKELTRRFPQLADSLHTVIGSVADEKRMDQVFREFAPHVVFHAAAHKHVPIMEKNVLEAVQNNVIGTYRIAECCGNFGVKRMVLISSDKAVNPSCIMGATKSICENTVRAMANVYPNTSFVSVRFGNVLGSRGSVVPIFKEQINLGGPVTVTHPDMTRYFMSIPEAVQLVMQAGAIGKSGDLFILDMGEPVKVVDLANDMIRLCGLDPGTDIQVICTGMRPGEKLHEELSKTDELIEATPYEELFAVHRPKYNDTEAVYSDIKRIQHMVNKSDVTGIRAFLCHMFPHFEEQANLYTEHEVEPVFGSAARL